MSALLETPMDLAEDGGAADTTGEFVSFPESPFQLFMPYPPAGTNPWRLTNWSRASTTA